jgi:hypothetical protein
LLNCSSLAGITRAGNEALVQLSRAGGSHYCNCFVLGAGAVFLV